MAARGAAAPPGPRTELGPRAHGAAAPGGERQRGDSGPAMRHGRRGGGGGGDPAAPPLQGPRGAAAPASPSEPPGPSRSAHAEPGPRRVPRPGRRRAGALSAEAPPLPGVWPIGAIGRFERRRDGGAGSAGGLEAAGRGRRCGLGGRPRVRPDAGVRAAGTHTGPVTTGGTRVPNRCPPGPACVRVIPCLFWCLMHLFPASLGKHGVGSGLHRRRAAGSPHRRGDHGRRARCFHPPLPGPVALCWGGPGKQRGELTFCFINSQALGFSAIRVCPVLKFAK